MDVLPDVLAPNLKVVFCGTAAGTRSAELRAYYARPGNKFWSILHRTGLTDRLLAPADYTALPQYGIGLTDLAKKTAGIDTTLKQEDFDLESFRNRILFFRPRALAFNGKKAAGTFLGRPCEYGRQPESIGDTALYVLPQTSGLASKYWDEAWWFRLASELS